MVDRRMRQLAWIGAAVVIGAAAPATATCHQVHQLLSQGLTIEEVANALGASVAAVQTCVHPGTGVVRSAPHSNPAGVAAVGPAGPPPIGAAGPPPLGAAGPPPIGAAGPPPLGAAGPAPISPLRIPAGSGSQVNKKATN